VDSLNACLMFAKLSNILKFCKMNQFWSNTNPMVEFRRVFGRGSLRRLRCFDWLFINDEVNTFDHVCQYFSQNRQAFPSEQAEAVATNNHFKGKCASRKVVMKELKASFVKHLTAGISSSIVIKIS